MNRLLMILILGISYAPSAQEIPNNFYVCPPCGSHCDDEKYSKPGACPHCNMVLIREDQTKTIAFYLQNGVEVLDFAGPMEVFAYAGYEVFTVSKTKDPIVSQGILTIVPDYSIEDAPAADVLAFFGGNAQTAFNDQRVIKWIKNQKEIQFHFSVCTGAFLLAEAEILEGKVATTFHDALDGLEENYSNIDVRRDARFVDNGKVITTAGISAGIDGALHLVAKLQGLNAAKRTAYYMEYDNWVPGDGVILSNDNPYQQELPMLEAYVGSYQFEEKGEIEVIIAKSDLHARLGETRYPLYHESADIFSDVTSSPIYFERDEFSNVIGYRLEPGGKLYKKLD